MHISRILCRRSLKRICFFTKSAGSAPIAGRSKSKGCSEHFISILKTIKLIFPRYTSNRSMLSWLNLMRLFHQQHGDCIDPLFAAFYPTYTSSEDYSSGILLHWWWDLFSLLKKNHRHFCVPMKSNSCLTASAFLLPKRSEIMPWCSSVYSLVSASPIPSPRFASLSSLLT